MCRSGSRETGRASSRIDWSSDSPPRRRPSGGASPIAGCRLSVRSGRSWCSRWSRRGLNRKPGRGSSEGLDGRRRRTLSPARTSMRDARGSERRPSRERRGVRDFQRRSRRHARSAEHQTRKRCSPYANDDQRGEDNDHYKSDPHDHTIMGAYGTTRRQWTAPRDSSRSTGRVRKSGARSRRRVTLQCSGRIGACRRPGQALTRSPASHVRLVRTLALMVRVSHEESVNPRRRTDGQGNRWPGERTPA